MANKQFSIHYFAHPLPIVCVIIAMVFLSACDDKEQSYQKGLYAYRTGNYESAVAEFQDAADKGHPEAMFKLALCYNDGNGVGKDKDKALDYLRKSADAGNVKARFMVISKDADDNKISREDVLKQFREMDAEMLKLAEANDPDAQNIYAMLCLLQGKRAEAKSWKEKSEANGGKGLSSF